MDPENQKSVKITTKDIDKAVKELAFWHSKKQASRDARREFMMKYVPDLQEISTYRFILSNYTYLIKRVMT